MESAPEILENKGIAITDIELRMLIEYAVAEFNDAFNRAELCAGIEVVNCELEE